MHFDFGKNGFCKTCVPTGDVLCLLCGCRFDSWKQMYKPVCPRCIRKTYTGYKYLKCWV